jgi:predicted DCC family thiol-disulfide oxidoreductase YuxK
MNGAAGDRLFLWTMISLISEITDSNGRRASRGWICFDRDCNFCTSLARRFRRTLEKRGFGLAALQDSRVAALLALPPNRLFLEMHVATTEGLIFGGSDAIVYLAGKIWWAYPLFVAAKVPGFSRILRTGYRWVAGHRQCVSGNSSILDRNRVKGSLDHAKGDSK